MEYGERGGKETPRIKGCCIAARKKRSYANIGSEGPFGHLRG